MTKLLFPPERAKPPQQAFVSNIFRLMREVHETPDPISTVIANIVGERERVVGKKYGVPYHIAADPDPTFFMEFWNMKQSGELPTDETPAVWAVLMCAVDVPSAVRIIIENCLRGGQLAKQLDPGLQGLVQLCEDYRSTISNSVTPPTVAKLRTKLVEALRETAARTRNALGVQVFDPQDAHLLLSACETALVVKKEESRRWLTRP